MKSYFRFLTLVFLCFVLFQDLPAQNTFNFGVTGGANRYSNRSDNALFPWVSYTGIVPKAINDDDCSYFAGIATEIKPFHNENSFLFKISYNNFRFKSIVHESIPTLDGDEIIQSKHNYIFDYNLKSIVFDIQYKYSFWKNVCIVAGFNTNYFIKSDVRGTYNLIEPADAHFNPVPETKYENDYRTIVMIDNTEMSGFNKTQFAVSIGARYDISLSDFQISPFMTYNYYLTKLMPEQNWKMTTISAGLDFQYKI